MLKALRVLRLLRVFRYMHSFRVLQTAVSSKAKEMWVSFQFLAIVTLMLSFVLFFYEHNAQPEVYDNGFKSVIWAFAQYVGDPGNFADTPPVTLVGRLIACIIGLLGIALFAVPAGLIGSGFSEAMENEKNDAIIKKNIDSIIRSFKFEKDQHFTQLFVVPRYKELNTILTRRFLTVEDIVRAVEASDCLHLYNMANASNAEDNPEDRIVVMNYKRNTPYGCCIDRGSKVTIVFTSGYTEACTGWFAYHIAKIGGFNYIAKDVEIDPDNPTSYYNVTADCKCPNFSIFLEDLNRLTSRPGSWAIPILAASGPRSRPHQFHFCYNPNKKDESFGNPESRVTDFALFGKLFDHVSSELKQKYDYNCDRNIYYAVSKKNIAHLIKADNVFTLRVECFVWMSDFRRVAVVKSLADCINAVLEPEIEKQLPPEMVSRVEGKDFGMQDYVD
jgi:voltage-gated potassium channel